MNPEMYFPTRESYRQQMIELRDRQFQMCCDLCCVDYLTHPGRTLDDGIRPERFEIVVNVLNLDDPARARVRVQVPYPNPEIDSIYDIYPGVEAMEREAYDMFGIIFRGHPDLSRILMPDEWEGFPLRKDYDIGAVPVQFK